MDEQVPYFFFSYSRADDRADPKKGDKYLADFFEDLRTRVADILGLAINETDPDRDELLNQVGFRDSSGVQTGQDWMDKIGKAIQHNRVLVCVYSPNFFSVRQNKQFCAKEFKAFLNRNPDIRYVRGPGQPGKEFELRGARNILPIIWLRFSYLQETDLPPYVLNKIQWALNTPVSEEVKHRYLQVGLRKIAIERDGDYDDIVDYFAGYIVKLAKTPLPPLPGVPNIETLPDAFRQPPEEDKIDHTTPPAAPIAGATVVAAISSLRHMLVIEVRRAGDLAYWCPYTGGLNIAALFEEVSNQKEFAMEWRTLDPSTADFADLVVAALRDANEKCIMPLLVLDPRCLADGTARGAFAALFLEQHRAGLLVPADVTDGDARRLIESNRAWLQPFNDAAEWLVRISIGNMAAFRTAISSVVDDIDARLFKTGVVQQKPPDNAGLTTLPRIANRSDGDAAR
jgi:hypothetical protein